MMMMRNINTCQSPQQQQQQQQQPQQFRQQHHQQQRQMFDNLKSKHFNAVVNNNNNGDNSINKTIQLNNDEIYSNYIAKQTQTQQQKQSQYIKQSKQLTSSGASSSETDISTSNENLTPEEHYVLKTSKRQEPQGEEQFNSNINDDNYSSQFSSTINKNNNNRLIIHNNNSLNNSINSYFSPYIRVNKDANLANVNNVNITSVITATTTNPELNAINENNKNNLTSFMIDKDNPYSNLNLLKYQNSNQSMSSNKSSTIMINSSPNAKNSSTNESVIKYKSSSASSPTSLSSSSSSSSSSSTTTTIQDNNTNNNLNNINDNLNNSAINLQQPMLNDYLNSLKKNDLLLFKNFNNNNNFIDNNNKIPNNMSANVMKSSSITPKQINESSSINYNNNNHHQMKASHRPSMIPIAATSMATTASMFGNMSITNSMERLTISRSHPDLSKFTDDDMLIMAPAPPQTSSAAINLNNQQESTMMSVSNKNNVNLNTQMNPQLDLLLIENQQLRNELDMCYKKIEKFQKFEIEIQKIYQSYDELMQSSERKEKFEREARYRLEIEMKKLQQQNKCLQERLDLNATTKKMNYDESDYEKELNKRGALISYLLNKNKELINYKERQEIELEAQRLTLQEQRNHIEILDTALINAQNNIMTLENELRSKQGWEEKTLFLEKAFSNLQSTNERRLQMEKRIRTYLEKELEKFKNIHNANNNTGDHNDKQQSPQPSDIEALKASIVNYEKRIIDLEAEVSKWEQKYLEENTLRSIEVSAASAPKDAKIAALERTTYESEKLIAEARNERLKHMDEIHMANKKCAELESQLKDLNFKLAEKETIINVLQKHSDTRDAVLQKTLRFTNNVTSPSSASRHSKSASTMGLVVGGGSSGGVSGSNIINNTNSKMITTAPTTPTNEYQLKLRTNGALMLDAASPSSVINQSSTMAASSTNLDEQIKEIESSQLTNKDSIINALRNEKERYPNHYNNWRL